jgi:peptidyl-prolyl cis-trans isomerase A (cyclophilin A)
MGLSMTTTLADFRKAAWMVLLTLVVSCHPGSKERIVIKTDLGDMVVEIETGTAPVTAKHFLSLVDRNVYTGSCFYRVVRPDNQPLNPVKIEVIQGGLLLDSLVEQFPSIPHEPTTATGIRHTDGVISMARNEPGSASTEFFICLGDQPSLDFGGLRNPDGQGFSAFGRVIRGMEVARAIQQQPDSVQMLLKPVRILEIRRAH